MKRTDLFKKLLPGLLPLFVFIIADAIWGTKTGLIVAIAFGILEMAFTFIRYKKFDRFILFDTLLLVALGGVSILLDNEIFFKLKPALVEAILCVILGVSTFSSKNLMLLMSKRYMKDMEVKQPQLRQMNRSIRILFWIVLLHTVLIVYAAYFLSDEAWAFISGGLFYIVFGVYFFYEFIRMKQQNKKLRQEEWLPLVNEKGEITGKAPRSQCHQGPGMLHPVVHLHIFNQKGELFLQKRPEDKLVQPGKWDTAVGGHVSFGDTIETGLKREANEELNISGFEPQLLANYKWETEIESEWVYLFITVYNQKIQINKEELADGKFWKLQEIEQELGQGIFTPNFEHEFKNYLNNIRIQNK